MNKVLQLILMLLADIIILSVTLIVFFVVFWHYQKSAVDYIALTFVLISEVALFTGSALTGRIRQNRLFVRAGVSTTLGLYWVAATLISILYRPLFGQHVNGLITTQIIVLALAMLIVIGILSFSLYIKSAGESTPVGRNVLQSCENAVFVLKSDERFKECLSQLNELYDALKYSDKTVELPDNENEISVKIEALRQMLYQPETGNSQTAVQEKIAEIILLVKERSLIARQQKKGGN